MHCPFCGHHDTQVKDSRPSEDGQAIRRRRFCPNCEARFTTFERVQLRELMVIKKNGDRSPFDRDKLAYAVHLAVRKRPIDEEQVNSLVNTLARELEMSGETEIPSEKIGEAMMDALADLDKVAYIRFASVYKDFNTAEDFEEFVEQLQN